MTEEAFVGKRGVLFAIVVAVGALAGTPSAQAQINPFRSYSGPTLTKEDISAGSGAFQKLLNREPASVGDTETWIDNNTGNQGKFTLRRIFQRSGMPCRAVASEIAYKRTKTKREFTLTACRVASGEWKLSH
jgi:hypothetical protein